MKLSMDDYGMYVMSDSIGAADIASEVEKRVKEIHKKFSLNINGLLVSGYTLADPRGRLAYEWEVIGTSSAQDTIVPCEPITRTWLTTPPRSRVAPPLPQRPWWKLWG